MTNKNERLTQVAQAKLAREALGGFRALINIDYTNDFVADNVMRDIQNSIKVATENVEYIIDWHSESRLFPLHCIEGTK